MPKPTILKDLGDGLILRRSTTADADALAEFNAEIHKEEDSEGPEQGVASWVRDLLIKPHPTFNEDDFTIVEQVQTGKIVSSLNLISQTWAYEGIPFGVGRPELVGTLPDYRNRGLVRTQFDVIHEWSAARGELVQAITGIPYYYRQFGYEMALDLGGGRTGYLPNIPKLKKDEQETYCIRPANAADLDFIVEMFAHGSQSKPVQCIWSRELFQYELEHKSPDSVNIVLLRIIEDKDGKAVGFLAHPPYRWGATLSLHIYEIKPGLSWAAVTPSVARYLGEAGKTLKPYVGKEPFGAFSFGMGREHPAYEVFKDRLPRTYAPYAWFIRVPDIAKFLQLITPALEERLAKSVMVGHTGEHKITFYRDGLRLKFEKGKLTAVEAHKPHPVGGSGDAGFPGLTFLQLLFGYRSLDELDYAFADLWANATMKALLPILFPKGAANIFTVS